MHSFNPSKSICFDIPNPNIFFAEDEFTIRKAQTICSHCPIRLDCLDWALFIEKDLEPEDIFGVYGGLTAMQRVFLVDTDL